MKNKPFDFLTTYYRVMERTEAIRKVKSLNLYLREMNKINSLIK